MKADGRREAISISEPEGSGAQDSDPADVLAGEDATSLKLYIRGERLILSDFMPILEDCGLRVLAVSPFEVAATRVASWPSSICSAVQDQKGNPLSLKGSGSLLARTILEGRAGQATNDSLNGLVLQAGLSWRQVEVLRTYASYAFQIHAVPSRSSLKGALGRYPWIARILFNIFDRRFNPEFAADPENRDRILALKEEFLSGLSEVADLVDDRALRRLFRSDLLDCADQLLSHWRRVPDSPLGWRPLHLPEIRGEGDGDHRAFPVPLRGLGSVAEDGGRAPSRSPRCPRGDPSLGSTGRLQDRSPGTGYDPDGQERRDRARGVEGGVRDLPSVRRAGGHGGGGEGAIPDLYARPAGSHR